MIQVILFLFSLTRCAATNAPIIGVLTEPTSHYGQRVDSYIAASYVKFLESGGARVIPIWINQTSDYYERVVNYTNGVLFPGGGADFQLPGGYGETASIIYNLAKKLNDDGRYFPLWGTCLGFEVLPFAEIKKDIRVKCLASKYALALKFEKGFRRSRLFHHLRFKLIKILLFENVTYNFHNYCLTESALKEHGLDKEWHILSSNYDKNNLKFISTMENRKYPFYGIQYHPEKNAFEFKEHVGFPHSLDSVLVSQYFANFFVMEARKNDNGFPNKQVELKSLIYNYSPQFTGKNNDYYYEIYGFNEKDYKNNNLL